MKKTILAAAAAAALFAVPAIAQAQAQAQVYGNVGYAVVDVDPLSLGAVQGRLGVQINPYFAIEGEAAIGVADDFGVELSHEVGVFAVGKMPVSEALNLFARLGYSTGELEGGGGSISGSGVAYGLGAEAFFTTNDGVRVDWTRHDVDGLEADVVAVAYVRRF